MSGRSCAVSVAGTYSDNAGLHLVHHLAFYDAADRADAEAQASDYCRAKWPSLAINSVIAEPVPSAKDKSS